MQIKVNVTTIGQAIRKHFSLYTWLLVSHLFLSKKIHECFFVDLNNFKQVATSTVESFSLGLVLLTQYISTFDMFFYYFLHHDHYKSNITPTRLHEE